jgi:hypothetical protein
MRTLVTVTCDRDRWTFKRQFKSALKCLTPCHWIIVPNNNDDTKWTEWFNSWQHSVPTNFTYEIISAKDIFRKNLKKENIDLLYKRLYGYNRQSVLKLVVADHVKTNEYVSIDSKIWFVRPTDINKIAQQDRDEYTMDIPTVDEGERLWKLRPKLISNQITPHVMDTKIVSEMLNSFGSINNYCEFFINGVTNNKWSEDDNKMQNLAEFYIYDIYCQAHNLLTDVKRENPWIHNSQGHFNRFNKQAVLEKIKHKDLQILSVWWHKGVISEEDKETVWQNVQNVHDGIA